MARSGKPGRIKQLRQEAQGQLDQAMASLQKVTTSYPTSFSAPLALISQGRILKSQGKTEEAKRAFETVINQFGETAFAQEAMRMNAQLTKESAPAAPVTPAPTSEGTAPATPPLPSPPGR